MSEDEAFIRKIVDSPGDDLPRLVYADWLDERDDPRGAYLRAEVEWAKTRQTTGFLVLRLHGLADGLDPVWVARVSRPPEGVCCDHIRFTECGQRLTPGQATAWGTRLGVGFPPEFAAFLINYNAGQVTPALPAPPDKPFPFCADLEWGFHPIGHGFGKVTEFERLHQLSSQGLSGIQARLRAEVVELARVNDNDSLFLGVGGDRTGKIYHFNGYDYERFHPDGLSNHADSLPRYLATLTAQWVHA
ncbi:MAG: TIGR02996 domain-containing protein [Gemmataceae bacterium]